MIDKELIMNLILKKLMQEKIITVDNPKIEEKR